jgi:hypothetical protein
VTSQHRVGNIIGDAFIPSFLKMFRIERRLEKCTIGVLEKFAEVIGCKVGEFFEEPDGAPIAPMKSGRKRK